MGSPRALLKKIKSKKSALGTIRLRRKMTKAVTGAAEAKSNDVNDQAWEYQVTSTPIPHEQPRGYFDWLTNKMNELSGAVADADVIKGGAATGVGKAKEPDTNQHSSDYGWSWFLSCWGHEAVLDKVDDVTDDTSTTEDSTLQSSEDSSDVSDETGESSVPSLSRVDQVLKLQLKADDEVSDITSVPSIDDTLSDSESEDLSQL